MPRSATHHIQKIAPGPPSVSAIATPAMLPVPTRDARPTQNAWNEEIPPSAAPVEPPTRRNMSPNSRTWTARVRTVNQMPAPMRT